MTMATDYMTELLRLIERDHQRLTDLESAVPQLRQELGQLREEVADEIRRRSVLSGRFDNDQIERGSRTR